MPPKSKANAAGVSASSLFDLKAELAKQEEDFAKRKAAGKGSVVVGGVKRPDKVCQWNHQDIVPYSTRLIIS